VETGRRLIYHASLHHGPNLHQFEDTHETLLFLLNTLPGSGQETTAYLIRRDWCGPHSPPTPPTSMGQPWDNTQWIWLSGHRRAIETMSLCVLLSLTGVSTWGTRRWWIADHFLSLELFGLMYTYPIFCYQGHLMEPTPVCLVLISLRRDAVQGYQLRKRHLLSPHCAHGLSIPH